MRRFIVPATVAALLVGCGGDDDEVAVSAECARSMRAMADVYNTADDDTFRALSAEALTACPTAAAWLQAARDRPDAVGKTDGRFVSADVDLLVACTFVKDAPACVDAVDTGLFVPCEGDPDQVCRPPGD